MAFGMAQTQLPFVNQSIARQLRSGAFRSKTQVGPQTAEAVTRGALEADRESALSQAGQASALKQQREIANQTAELEKSRQVETQRQADITAQYQADTLAEDQRQADMRDKFDRDQLAADKRTADAEAARAYEQSRQAEKQKESFWDGAFGS